MNKRLSNKQINEYLKTATPGSLKIEKIDENKDGSATVHFLVPNVTKKLIKEYYGVKRFTKKLFKKFMRELLTEAIYNSRSNIGKRKI